MSLSWILFWFHHDSRCNCLLLRCLVVESRPALRKWKSHAFWAHWWSMAPPVRHVAICLLLQVIVECMVFFSCSGHDPGWYQMILTDVYLRCFQRWVEIVAWNKRSANKKKQLWSSPATAMFGTGAPLKQSYPWWCRFKVRVNLIPLQMSIPDT